MRASSDVLTLGETMIMVAPLAADPVLGMQPHGLRPGGAESNVAVHLARLGHAVEWGGIVGDDILGELVTRTLRDIGVTTRRVVATPERPTGVYFKHLEKAETSVSYYRTNSAGSGLDSQYLERFSADSPRVLHLTGVTPALSEEADSAISKLLIERSISADKISFDVNYRKALWQGRNPAEKLKRYANHADIVFVGLDEANAIWGANSPAEVRSQLPDPETVVIKDGGNGATAFFGQNEIFLAAPVVKVIEPIGAGDAFAAGWLSGMLRGLDQHQRLALGHEIASHILRTTFDDVELPIDVG